MTLYTAKRLPVHNGPAAWSEILAGQPPACPLKTNSTADFIVIGAGFAGLAAVKRLLQINPTAKVTLLEAGRLAQGAAGRNSGFMIDLPHELTSEDYAGQTATSDQQLIALNRAAIAFARNIVDEYGITEDWFDQRGKVNGAASHKGEQRNNSYAEHLLDINEPHEKLDAQQMFELTGSRYYRSGLHTPGTVLLQPAGFIRGFGKGVSQAATIHENSPVTSLKRNGSSWTVSTATAEVSSETVILANNGHLESFGFAENHLMHVFLSAVMTPDIEANLLAKIGGQKRWGITPSDPMGTTIRKIDTALGGNRIITRTCASFRPEMQATTRDLHRARLVMQKKFDQRFPEFAGMKMEYAWSGHLCLSLNNVSLMKKLDDGLISACCQNGLGTTRGILNGIAAAELASGHTSEILHYFTQQNAPKKLPVKPLASIGANTVLRYKEWKAGKE